MGVIRIIVPKKSAEELSELYQADTTWSLGQDKTAIWRMDKDGIIHAMSTMGYLAYDEEQNPIYTKVGCKDVTPDESEISKELWKKLDKEFGGI